MNLEDYDVIEVTSIKNINPVQIDKFGHEVIEVTDSSVIKTLDPETRVSINAPITRIFRHAVTKERWVVKAKGKQPIIMTGDHGCMVCRAPYSHLVQVKPCQINTLTDELICYDENDVHALPTYTAIESVYQDGYFDNEYVYDVEVADNHMFYANDTLVHNSCYLTFGLLFDRKGWSYVTPEGKASKEAYTVSDECENYINDNISIHAKTTFNSKGKHFVFKRESIADKGLFLMKKRYGLHVLDDEGVPCDKFKYTGVELARIATPAPVKKYLKEFMDTLIISQDRVRVDKIISDAYEAFMKLSPNDVSIISGVNDTSKYNLSLDTLKCPKGCPWHVKAAHAHNYLVNQLKLTHKYEAIKAGDKMKIVSLKQPNRYDLDRIAFKESFPKEFEAFLKIDLESLFDRHIFNVVTRTYEAVNWDAVKPGEKLKYAATDLFI